jgi:SAM-dependent methyltransferase
MHQDFLDRFVVGRSGRLLDMGCGLGFFVRAVAAHPGWEAHGCEISEAAVRYANEVLSQPRVVRARLAEAPGAKASFDVITMWDVLDHILEPDVLLRRCHELLKPAGLLFIRTPNIAIHLPRARLKKLVLGERPGRSYLMARDHFHHYAPGTLRRLLERNGFSDVQFLHLHPIDNPSPSLPSRFARSCWLHLSRGLATATRGRLNIDNLYACARKRA